MYSKGKGDYKFQQDRHCNVKEPLRNHCHRGKAVSVLCVCARVGACVRACVWVPGRVGVCMCARACSIAFLAYKTLVPFCISICGLFG